MLAGCLVILTAMPCIASDTVDLQIQNESTSSGKLSPLERLKQRSAERRWKAVSEQFSQPPATLRLEAERHAVPVSSTRAVPLDAEATVSAKLPAPIPETPRVAMAQPQEAYPDPVRDPSKLKKVTSILPYYDYEPNEETAKDDPLRNQCPRPDGAKCKPGERVPECPEEVALSNQPYEGRAMSCTVFQWKASNLYHNPLYFEDVPLERYGHTHHELIQPFMSVGKFGVQLIGLPYQMTIDPCCKKMYALGWYRPGECLPKMYRQIPWNTDAAVHEAGILTGLAFAIP